jgi:exopolysaccharide production protein ExoQ
VSYQNGDLSLTGRVMVWMKAVNSVESEWLLGNGFAVFNSPNFDYIWGSYRPPHAHNSFVSIYFEGGFVGVSMLVILVFVHFYKSTETKIIGQNKYNYSNFVFFMAFLSSLTGVTYAGKPSILYSLLFIFIAMDCNKTIKYAKF